MTLPEVTVNTAAGDCEQSTSTSLPSKNFAGRLSAVLDCDACAAAARLAASCSSTSNGELCGVSFCVEDEAADAMPYFCSFASLVSRSRASAATCGLLLVFKRSSKVRAASHFLSST